MSQREPSPLTPPDSPEGDKLVMRNSMLEFLDDICSDDEDKQKCKGWKIVDVNNMENENGLYAITIEKGRGNEKETS